jgi:hypothetical protein
MPLNLGGNEISKARANQIVNTNPVFDNLVFNLDAGLVSSYPGSGTTWTDIAGSNNGTLNNGPTFYNSNGGAISFDGTNDNVSISPIVSAYPFTVDIWATHPNSWIPTTDATMNELLNMSIGGQRVSIGTFRWDSSGWTAGPSLMYGGTNHWAINAVSNGLGTGFTNITWVVFGSNNTNHKMFVNGTSRTMVNNGGSHGGSAGWAIASNSTGGEYWPGRIASMRVYNTTLSDAQVLQNYQTQKQRLGV